MGLFSRTFSKSKRKSSDTTSQPAANEVKKEQTATAQESSAQKSSGSAPPEPSDFHCFQSLDQADGRLEEGESSSSKAVRKDSFDIDKLDPFLEDALSMYLDGGSITARERPIGEVGTFPIEQAIGHVFFEGPNQNVQSSSELLSSLQNQLVGLSSQIKAVGALLSAMEARSAVEVNDYNAAEDTERDRSDSGCSSIDVSDVTQVPIERGPECKPPRTLAATVPSWRWL